MILSEEYFLRLINFGLSQYELLIFNKFQRNTPVMMLAMFKIAKISGCQSQMNYNSGQFFLSSAL